MITPTVTLIIPDGSGSLAVPTTPLGWIWGDDVTIPFVLKRANGAIRPLTGPIALIMAFKEKESDPLPLLSLSMVIDDAANGLGHFDINRTYGGLLSPGYFVASVQFEDDTTPPGTRDTVLRPSRIAIELGVASLDQVINVPSTQDPLAQGPKGDDGADGQGITWRGPYSPILTYAVNDGVSNTVGGVTSSYIATAAVGLGVSPPSAPWQLMASPGLGALPDPALLAQGTVPIVDNGVWDYRPLNASDIQASFAVASMVGGGGYAALVEFGGQIINPSFAISYTSGPATSASINDGSGAQALTTPFTAYSFVQTYAFATIGHIVTWALAALKGTASAARSVSATGAARVFYDVAVPGTYNAAFIAALTGQALATSFQRTIVYGNPGGTKKLYYAFPTSFGTPSHFKDLNINADQAWSKVASAVSVTNSLGGTTTYDLWASDNILNAPFTIGVT